MRGSFTNLERKLVTLPIIRIQIFYKHIVYTKAKLKSLLLNFFSHHKKKKENFLIHLLKKNVLINFYNFSL